MNTPSPVGDVMPTSEPAAFRLADFARGQVSDRNSRVDIGALASGAWLRSSDDELAGRSVLLATQSQILSAVATVELDGLARRIVVAPPGLRPDHVEAIIADAGIDLVVTDDAALANGIRGQSALLVEVPVAVRPQARRRGLDTQWVLLTSGTSGRPKMVVHSLGSLTGAIQGKPAPKPPQVWSTFYDIRRYGGLQIFLRAVLGGAELALTDPDEPIADQLARLGAGGVTSMSGTPSHWRRVLITGDRGAFAPSYIRLSGEIADQVVLDGLREAFPTARIEHAYAATETGVGFVVDDGREGFPAAFIDRPANGVEMKIVDGALRVRSSRIASGYVIDGASPLVDSDGFIDTTDLVERRGDRCFFIGRRNGVINVGGLKVSPEEVEAVLNGHPGVRMSRVFGRKNTLTGAIVMAEIVRTASSADEATLTHDILSHCRERLERHKAPVSIRFVDHLDLSAAGKLNRGAAQD